MRNNDWFLSDEEDEEDFGETLNSRTENFIVCRCRPQPDGLISVRCCRCFLVVFPHGAPISLGAYRLAIELRSRTAPDRAHQRNPEEDNQPEGFAPTVEGGGGALLTCQMVSRRCAGPPPRGTGKFIQKRAGVVARPIYEPEQVDHGSGHHAHHAGAVHRCAA
jgi:hypothetical protein